MGKHFELSCFITEGVCSFDMRYKCREALKASFRTQAQRACDIIHFIPYIILIWGDC